MQNNSDIPWWDVTGRIGWVCAAMDLDNDFSRAAEHGD